MSEWQPIEIAPINRIVDLWCIDCWMASALWETGSVIGRLVPRRHKSAEYGWFGNQSNAGISHE